MDKILARINLNEMLKHKHFIVTIGIVSVVLMLVIPLPPIILDILIAINITIAIFVILISMYVESVLDFSVFPSLLLVVTMFRLGLNVASTRLILIQGVSFQGEIIRAFGEFVAGNNPVVGFVIFIILVVIQFMVITKGATRVSEVQARFTLDAMPQKQLSVDGDLNAGIITEEEAKKKRNDIRREADFYGAMDGSSKFVQGDAVAGIIITVINIIGGLVIGCIFHGEPFMVAIQSYSLLTIGDGLVSQIPALLISVATGLIVTRSAAETNLGEEIANQFISDPTVMFIAAGVAGVFAIVPGMPTFPFLTVALTIGFVAYLIKQTDSERAEKSELEKEKEETEDASKKENVASLLVVEPMELEIGYKLINLAVPERGGDLLDRVVMIRHQIAREFGFVIPTIRIRDNMQLAPDVYSIKIRGNEVATGEVIVDSLLAMNPGTVSQKLDGKEAIDPVFGLPAIWITEAEKDIAEMNGYMVVDSPSVIITHITEIIKRYSYEIFGNEELETIIETLDQNYPNVVDEVFNKSKVEKTTVMKVMRNLLKEQVSVRDSITILETIAELHKDTKDIGLITEYVRIALKRSIVHPYVINQNMLPIMTLDAKLDQVMQQNIDGDPAQLRIDYQFQRMFIAELRNSIDKMKEKSAMAVLVCSPELRRHIKWMTEAYFPQLVVLSYMEIPTNIEMKQLIQVRVEL